MNLHCLGTAGYHPSETRHTSCYALPSCGLVLDAGTGMFRLPPLIQTRTLDILLSHAHLDHVFGLTFLLGISFQRATAGHPLDSIRVWGEREKIDAIENHLLHPLLFPAPLPIQWQAIEDHPVIEIQSTPLEDSTPMDVKITWRRQTHPGQSIAYRIDAVGDTKGSMVFATDTTGARDSETLSWMAGADLLLHECNFHAHQQEWAEKTGHCWLTKVAEICARTGPDQVVLTHVDPMDELTNSELDGLFDMPARIAADGVQFTIFD